MPPPPAKARIGGASRGGERSVRRLCRARGRAAV